MQNKLNDLTIIGFIYSLLIMPVMIYSNIISNKNSKAQHPVKLFK